MISKFLAVTIALAASHVANAVDPYVVTRSTTIVNHDGTDYYRQVFSVELSDIANERVNGLLNTDAAFDSGSLPESYSVSFSGSSTTYPLSRASSGTIAPDTDIVFARDSGTFQATGAPIGSYWAPGVADAATLQTIKNTCSGAATMTGGWPTNVAPWGSTTDVDKGFTFSISADAACAALTQDSGSGVVLGVMVSESPVSFVRFMISVYNVNDASSRLLVLESAFDTDTTGPLADYVCIDKVYSGSSMNPTIYANNALAAYDSSSGACSTYTPPAGLQKGCDDVWSLTPTEEDACGVCGGDNSTCTGCRNNTACNYDATATIDDEASCDFASCVGCDNVTYLPHVDGPIPQAGIVDDCQVCGGDGTSCVQPCSFHAPGTLFPSDLIYVTENSNGDSTDGDLKLTFNWDSSKEASQTNYYFLDAASSGTAFDGNLGASIQPDTLLNGKGVLSDFAPVGFPDFNLTSNDPGNVADSTGTGTGSVTHTINADGSTSEFIYEGPDQDVLIMIGAASTCVTSRETVDYVYIRSVYKFRVKERLSMEKTVDDSGFASYVARYGNDVQGQEPLLVTQQDLTQSLQTKTAQHVMKTRNLEVHSNLEGPAGHDCLGANLYAEASYSESNGDSTVSVTNNNSAVICTITATGDISNYVQAADNRDTTYGYDDTDIDQATDDAGEGNVVFSDFYIALALSQYTQMASQSDYSIGNTWDAIDADWDVTTTSDETGLWGKQDGSDVRTDLCRLKRHNLGGSGSDIDEKSANLQINLDTHVVLSKPAEQDHTGVAVNDPSRQGTYALNDEAHVKCSFSPFQLTSDDAGVTGARYSPLVYVRAWFDYGKGELQSDYGGSRRLRSSKQLTSGMRKNTVHYMHIRLARKN
jgi:hypothetical protein